MIILIIETNDNVVVKNISQVIDEYTKDNDNEPNVENLINRNNSALKEIQIKN